MLEKVKQKILWVVRTIWNKIKAFGTNKIVFKGFYR